MVSNLYTNRRGQLSRPGVCTPPPLPPPPTAIYVYTLDHWDSTPASETLWLWLTATDPAPPDTDPAQWSHDTNGNLGNVTHHSSHPDTLSVQIYQANDDPIIYIHSTLDAPGAPVPTASFFFPRP